jgi:hypothetical protein
VLCLVGILCSLANTPLRVVAAASGAAAVAAYALPLKLNIGAGHRRGRAGLPSGWKPGRVPKRPAGATPHERDRPLDLFVIVGWPA